MESIRVFVGKYNLDFYINEEMDAEDILNSLFTAFLLQKKWRKNICNNRWIWSFCKWAIKF
mgnify:CR=1 FL=1